LKARARLSALLLAAAAWAPLPAQAAGAQTREAVQTKFKQPAYPENLMKTEVQGNVFLVGRIDKEGRIKDLHVSVASDRAFVAPAVEAVEAWRFRPAMRDGQPIQIFANVGVRFRLQTARRGQIPAPILGDLSISPADEQGRRTAPEGFPIRRGQDRGLRAEASLDVPPQPQARTLALRVEAISPSGKRFPIFQPPVSVPASATEVRIPVVTKIGEDWEEGVWILLFAVDGANAGSGQFWLAADPARFSFVIPDRQ
jgi:TonB family protein